jgi:DNA modification methylase
LILLRQEEPKNISRINLHEKYKDKLIINPELNRSLISFQANKNEPIYRWFKYKEGFSSKFVKYILDTFKKPGSNQVVLDPFSGIGTTITTAIESGYNSIE